VAVFVDDLVAQVQGDPAALEVGGRDEEIDLRDQPGRIVCGRPRRRLAGRRVHAFQGLQELAVHPAAVQKRAGSGEGRLQPLEGGALVVDQDVDVALVQPELFEPVHRAAVGERLGQENRVDPAGRSAGEDVDHEARPQQPGQLAVDLLGSGERFGTPGGRRGGPDQAEELLADAVDVNRERNAAVHHDGKALLMIDFLGRHDSPLFRNPLRENRFGPVGDRVSRHPLVCRRSQEMAATFNRNSTGRGWQWC
jgi:hypothetical protein